MSPLLRSWPRQPLVYEINTRVWLREQSLAAGRPLALHEVPDHVLDRFVTLGFDAVWLMGVWTTGAVARAIALTEPSLQAEYLHALPDLTRDDVIGSPYAVARYDVAPSLGGLPALAGLRERLARRGLRLFLDFVPNHLACDHPATLETPAAFVGGTAEDLAGDPRSFFPIPGGDVLAHGRDPFFPAWTDTAQVDVTSEEGRALLHAQLAKAAVQCDGVRCDMAMLLLPDVFARTWGARARGFCTTPFWPEAVARVRELFPYFLFIAESYWGLEQRLLDDGFDYAYDKTLYDRLKAGDVDGVRAHLQAPQAHQERCLRFIENHDEPRAVAAFGRLRSRSAAAATLCAPGLRLLHEGQEEGWQVKLPVQLGRRPPAPADPETRAFYERLLGFLSRAELRQGQWRLLEVHPDQPGGDSHRGLVAYLWQSDAATSLVVVNLHGERRWGRIPLGVVAGLHVLHDHADDMRYEREGWEMQNPGLFVALDPFREHLFELEGSGTRE
jgi:hypothetical protein